MLKVRSQLILKSILNSYSHIFFSDGKLLGITLLLVSFLNVNAGFKEVVLGNTKNILTTKHKIISDESAECTVDFEGETHFFIRNS